MNYTTTFLLLAMLASAAVVTAGRAGHGHGHGNGGNWREREYEDCSAVASRCRSALCDTSRPSSDLWNRWTGIDIMTHGTGTPYPTHTNRYATGIVLPDGTYLLIDAGTGVARDLGTYKCQDWTVKLRHLAMTHYHSDHVGDMGFLLNIGYVNGRRGPANAVKTYGPQGLGGMASALRAFYTPDAFARVTAIINGTCHFVATPGNADSLLFTTHEFNVNATSPIVPVFSHAGLNVTAMLVPHNSMFPAVGYVLQTEDVKIVLSGDTAYSTMVQSMASDADYLIHEVMNRTFVLEEYQLYVDQGNPKAQTFFCNVPNAHTHIDEVAQLAQAARVKNLILTHIVPQMDPDALTDAIRAAGYTYGNVFVADDGDYWKVLTH